MVALTWQPEKGIEKLEDHNTQHEQLEWLEDME